MSRRLSNPESDPGSAASQTHSKIQEAFSHPAELPDTGEAPEERAAAEMLERPHVPALDAMLGKPFPVLDDGFVRVLDYMGDDAAVVQAARISYGAGTKQVHQDRGLIRYLLRHAHSTPYEMCEIKLHVRVPMDTWRQWVRHRTASVNEYSTRYSVAIDATQQTPPDEWRLQSALNRQGSAGTLPRDAGEKLSAAERLLQNESRRVYEERLASGVAREQARKDLPLSTYTEAYWKINLHNLLHFLNLRMDDHAQEEIRAYARVIGEQIVAVWVPLVWEAFLDYRRHAMQLSGIEVELVRLISQNDRAAAIAAAERHGLLSRRKDGSLARNRERAELEQKLAALGLKAPWA
jgi:thymidylate synthase (FAD)